jgi:hypothetical protein
MLHELFLNRKKQKSPHILRIAVKKKRWNDKVSLEKIDLSFCLRDCGLIPCPFGIRVKRTSPDCYPSAVFVASTPESITPLERLIALSPADFI